MVATSQRIYISTSIIPIDVHHKTKTFDHTFLEESQIIKLKMLFTKVTLLSLLAAAYAFEDASPRGQAENRLKGDIRHNEGQIRGERAQLGNFHHIQLEDVLNLIHFEVVSREVTASTLLFDEKNTSKMLHPVAPQRVV
jgi:hypothetical protein